MAASEMFEPLTDRSIQLTDGRSMAFAEWDVLDGPAVVYFPGTPHSRLWCPDVGATEAAGVHLVTVDRPGYGRSDLAPAEVTMGDWTSDVVELADALDLARFGVVGWSSGGLSAVACATRIPERLTGAGEIGGAGWPVDEQPGVLEALSDNARRIHDLAWNDRSAAVQLAEELAPDWINESRDHPESVMDRDADPPQDLRHFDDPAWAASFYRAVRDSLRLGGRAYAWETVAGLGPWGFAIRGRRAGLPPVARCARPPRTPGRRRVLGRPPAASDADRLRGLRALRRRRSLDRDAVRRGRSHGLAPAASSWPA